MWLIRMSEHLLQVIDLGGDWTKASYKLINFWKKRMGSAITNALVNSLEFLNGEML